jgi:hypothetical protein
MAVTKNIHLRLRTSTYDKLRAVHNVATHLSMNSLIDEMLEKEANRRIKIMEREAKKNG